MRETVEPAESTYKRTRKRIIRGWTFYDWANSVFPLVISSAIFPVFYEGQTGSDGAQVSFFGMEISNTQLYTFVISLGFLIVSVMLPLLSGIADYTGNKKRFLQIFCYMGAISTASLFFFDADALELSMLSLLLASIGFWSSLVFYNAYLPEIAKKEEQDRVSARGFSMGYLGSATLLGTCIALILIIGGDDPEMKGKVTRWCFVLVGIWWIGFSQITYRVLPNVSPRRAEGESLVSKGYKELGTVWRELKENLQLKRFLYGFFLLSMAVQTIMVLAALFGATEIDWPIDPKTGDPDTSGLIIAILLIQFVAIPGSFAFSALSRRIGNIRVLMIAVLIWVAACGAAYFTHSPVQFYALAALVGFIMGGTQALTRSTYSKMLPETKDTASYFSFYDVSEKVAITLGTLSFGLIEGWTDSMRYSALAMASFFILAFIALWFVPRLKDKSVA